MWVNLSPNHKNELNLNDKQLAELILGLKTGVAVIETGTRGSSKYVVCQLRREEKTCTVLSADHLAQELVRGIRNGLDDPRCFLKALILEHETNILLITEDIYAKEATQTEFGRLLREIGTDRLIILVTKNVSALPYMLSEMEDKGHLFSWVD